MRNRPGSNALRLSVVDPIPRSNRAVHEERILAFGGRPFRRHPFTKTFSRKPQSVPPFSEVMEEFESPVPVVATSATRESTEPQGVFRTIKKEIGIALEVISARRGIAVWREAYWPVRPGATRCIVDLGGGAGG